MIFRKFHWILLLSLHLFFPTHSQQNGPSYDTNDWIPINPTHNEENTKKATGRVLNLDTPNENFFPPDEYNRKRASTQQYLRETDFQKGRSRPVKVEQPYKFEPVVPQYVQEPPQYIPQQPPPQYVEPVRYLPRQPPPPEPVLTRQLVAPPQNNQNYYNTNQQQEPQQPYNNTFHQSLNPGLINRGLVGVPNVNQIEFTTTLKPKQEEKENVQLLYVPLENLKPSQQVTQQSQEREQKQLPQVHKQHQLENIEDDFLRQALAAHRLQQQFQLGQPVIVQTTTTTPKPKKRKPNQPPLAVYMEKDGPAEVKDVLGVLKRAKTISVLDSIGPNSPQVFVGPSNLKTTDDYVKFPLPYLSSVDGNRIERKVDQLPFFVAPLSYKAPEGYSKIPLPSPHVGSVVVSTKEEEKQPGRHQQVAQNQISQDFDVRQPFGQQYEDEVKPNPYLPQAQNFLSGYRNQDFGNNYPKVQSFNPAPLYPSEETPNQTPQDYEIPSLPADSKTRFVPSYPVEEKPQSNQYSIDQGRPNVYTYDEEPLRQTTTSESPPITQYRFIPTPEQQFSRPNYSPKQNNEPQDSFRPIINQYDVEQINNQFVDGTPELRSTTPVVISTHNYNNEFDPPTTVRTKPRTRQRSRITTTSTTTSTTLRTPNLYNDEPYRILEEFPVPIQPKTTTAKYTTEVETIPAKVYKLPTEQVEPVYISNTTPGKHVLDQAALDEQILHHKQNPVSSYQDAHLEPLVYNRGQTAQEVNQFNPYLPGLINNLQDQAVKSLLLPNLLVPTTEKLTSLRPLAEEVQREVVTTERVVETTTTPPRRNRGRQRANTSRQSTTSAPRRAPSRRRPVHTRTTTERQILRGTTEAVPVYEPTKRTSSTRQRFRTRGRPLTKESSTPGRGMQTTTQNTFKQPPLEGGFQASSDEPQSYMQFDHVIENQQVITVKPESGGNFKEYHQVYSMTPQILSDERVEITTTTPKPVVNVQITHSLANRGREPQEEPQYRRVPTHIQSGGVIHNQGNSEEVPSRPNIRIRGRTRGKLRQSSSTTRPSTTSTTTTTTTSKPKEDDEEEFFGFIRNPNYNRPASLVHTTQQPLQLYSASYQEPPRTLIQLEDSGAEQTEQGPSTPVQFIGEIRPKYQTTTTEAPEITEPPRFRTRGRVRTSARKPTSQTAYNEVKSQKLDDQVTRRSSNIIRSRNRGASHYKLPENLATKPDDHDVEGGNYPTTYLKAKDLTTEKPSGFQITIDPYEEELDQEPHSSLFNPQIIKNVDTEWVEASILPTANDLVIEDKNMVVTNTEEATTTEREEEIPTTTFIDTTTFKQRQVAKKRGVWKLVKQRPVESFETAESQNYHSILNNFDEILKEKVVTSTSTTSSPTTTTTENSSILDALYNMFGLSQASAEVTENNNQTIANQKTEEITTTALPPTFPEEFTEAATTIGDILKETTTVEDVVITTTVEPPTMKTYEVEPWDMRKVQTSTTTEVTHETEICFKGRCVKSKDEKETNL